LIVKHSEHPKLKNIFKTFNGYCESLYEISIDSQNVIANRGKEGVALYATPFLMFFSSVTAGWLLLEQAVIASEELKQIKEKKGVSDMDESNFILHNKDALFYSNKIKTVRYFVECIIPQFDVLLIGGKKQNYDPLDITF